MAFWVSLRKRQECPLFPLLFNIIIEVSSNAIGHEKSQIIWICKEVKISLENTRESMNNKMNLNNELNKLSRYI